MRKRVMLVICLIGFVGPANAHAFLESATPAVGGIVPIAPKEVAIRFSESVEPAFSAIEVTNGAGKRVDTGKPHSPPDDGRMLMVDLLPLAPGAYHVLWHVVSVDTHKTQGSFSFTVAP